MAPLSLTDRLAGLSLRERRFLAAGAIALLLFLLYLLWPGEGEEERVVLADAPPVAIAPPPPAPLPVVTAPPPAALPAAMPAGILLQGVSGGGAGGGAALFQYPGGNQRLVRIGREVAPGTVLKSLGPTFVLVSSGGVDLRLDLGKSGAVQVAAALPAPAAAVGTTMPQAAERIETTELRLGLKPVEMGGRVRGYEFRSGASLPRLQQAGLRAGDIITGVNGSMLDEERLTELSWAMSNSERTEFDVIRDGKPIKLALQPGTAR